MNILTSKINDNNSDKFTHWRYHLIKCLDRKQYDRLLILATAGLLVLITSKIGKENDGNTNRN